MTNIVPFPGAVRPAAGLRSLPRVQMYGEIYVVPSCTDAGSWAIVHVLWTTLHVSKFGDHHTCIRDGIFNYTDAERIAEQIARDYRARFGFADYYPDADDDDRPDPDHPEAA